MAVLTEPAPKPPYGSSGRGSSNVIGVKFMFSKKATIKAEIFTIDLTLCSKCQIGGEDFVNFCGFPRKHELYIPT